MCYHRLVRGNIAADLLLSDLSASELLAMIGKRMSGRRLGANLSQAELAARAGLSRHTILRLETGANVGTEALLRVAIALDATPEFVALFPERDLRTLDEILAEQRAPQRRRVRKRRPA